MKSGITFPNWVIQNSERIRTLPAALFVLGFSWVSNAQEIFVGYDFTTNTMPTTVGAGIVNATSVVPGAGAETGVSQFDIAGTIGDQTGIAASGTIFGSTATGSYGKTNQGLGGGNLQFAIDDDQYLGFSFNAATPGTLNITSFSVDTGISNPNRAANEFNVLAQVNGGNTWIVANALTADQINSVANSQANAAWESLHIDLSGNPAFQGISSAEFRIYLWGGAGPMSSSRMGFDQLLIEGNYIDITQLFTSAIPSNIAAGKVASQVHGTALRDLNKRIFRLRSRIGSGGGFAQIVDEGRGREVSASRLYRLEKELKVQSTINLNGPAKASSPENAAYQSAVVDDQSPWVPTVIRQAGGTGRNDSAWNGMEAYASYDYGHYDLNPLGQNAGVESRTRAGTVGVEHVVNPCLAAGLGFTHVQSDNDLSGDLGSIDMEGNAVSAYASYFKDNLWGDFLYSYGSYETEISRNTGMGSTVSANPDLDAHQTTLNLGYNIPCQDRFVHGPTFRTDYSWGRLEGYTERGDPTANTRFQAQHYESLITTIGWQVNWKRDTCWGALLPQLRLGYGRELNDQETNVSGTLQNIPVTLGLNREDPGEGWMEFGAGVGFDLQNNFSITVDYQGRFFQQDAEQHMTTIKGGWRF